MEEVVPDRFLSSRVSSQEYNKFDFVSEYENRG